MTPADLAELLKTTAAAVLAERDLDASALPAMPLACIQSTSTDLSPSRR